MSYTVVNDINSFIQNLQDKQSLNNTLDSNCKIYTTVPVVANYITSALRNNSNNTFIDIVETIRFAEGLPDIDEQVKLFNDLSSERFGDVKYIREYLRALKKSSRYWDDNIANDLTQDISDLICLLTYGHTKDTTCLDPEDWHDHSPEDIKLDFPPPIPLQDGSGYLNTRRLEGGASFYPKTTEYKLPNYVQSEMTRQYQTLCKLQVRCMFRERFATRSLPGIHPEEVQDSADWKIQGDKDPPFSDIPVSRIAPEVIGTDGNQYSLVGFRTNGGVFSYTHTGDYTSIAFSYYFPNLIETNESGSNRLNPENIPELSEDNTGIRIPVLYSLIGYDTFICGKAGFAGLLYNTGEEVASPTSFLFDKQDGFFGDPDVPPTPASETFEIDSNGNKVVASRAPDDDEISSYTTVQGFTGLKTWELVLPNSTREDFGIISSSTLSDETDEE